MATARDRDARAFGAAANFMPSRQGDKNNRYLVGHAAFGQGLTLLERCEFEDALISLEGAWSVWKEVFVQSVSSSESDKSGDENEAPKVETQVTVEIYTPGSDSSSNSEDIPPPPKQHHSPLEANAERFFRAKACVNLGKNKGASAKRVGSTGHAMLSMKGFAEEEDRLSDVVDDFLGTWPPVNNLDTFASCFDDALALRIQKEAEDEAFACALEAQNAVGRGRPPPSTDSEENDDEDDGDDDDVLHEEAEEEDLTNESYTRMMYKRDVQQMMKPAEVKSSAPPRVIGAKPQFHHFRRLMRGLCHCYVRLRRWAEMDRIIDEAMPYFGHPVGSLRPSSQKFKTPAMEEPCHPTFPAEIITPKRAVCWNSFWKSSRNEGPWLVPFAASAFFRNRCQEEHKC